MDNTFYTRKEIAERLKLSTRQINRYIRSRKLKIHKFGRSTRISEKDFRDFIKKHKNK